MLGHSFVHLCELVHLVDDSVILDDSVAFRLSFVTPAIA